MSAAEVGARMPTATPEQTLIVSRLVHWFFSHGYGPEQVIAACPIEVGGGRRPDLTIWAKGKPPHWAGSTRAGIDGLLVVVEVSADGEVTDRVFQRAEYAAAGVARYWIVDGDKANNVQMLSLREGDYEPERPSVSLAWLLNEPAPALVG